MVLAVSETQTPNILFLTDDIKFRTNVIEDHDLYDFELLFTTYSSDILSQINGSSPQLAVIDCCNDLSSNIKITNILKQKYDIPIILLIDPGEISQLELATKCRIDSVFTKPLQPSQLAITIQFYLLKAQEEKPQFCMPRRCNVVNQQVTRINTGQIAVDTVIVLDKQDFVLKIRGLLDRVDKENTIHTCVSFQIQDHRKIDNPHWKKESLNLTNRIINHINESTRYGDILAKEGASQYLMLFPDMDKYNASLVIKRLNRSISNLVNEGDDAKLEITAGACIFAHNSAVENILENMDLASNEASRMGDGALIIKSLLDARSEKNTRKVSYANIIQTALKDDAFFLHYQPISSLTDNTVKHYEALIRLHDNNGQFVSPMKIITAAESNRQIKEIDIRILDLVMRKLTSMEADPDDLMISVNLSGTHFGDEGLLQDICVLIDYYGIDPSHLVFEMTETAAVKDLQMASSFISRLKDLGCHFGLDDFGTGYASFSYLRALPVDYLKIDGTFVRELVHNPADQLFIKAIVDVARGINVKTIAECVEDRETLEMLSSFGVDFAQGFYLGKPQPMVINRQYQGKNTQYSYGK